MEQNERLQINFVQQLISNYWSEIDLIKTDIAGISEYFCISKQAEEILQNLIDAYLISIVQLEELLDNITIHSDSNEHENKEAIAITPISQINEIRLDTNFVPTLASEEFEYTCDFDEPDLSIPGLTDEDLY